MLRQALDHPSLHRGLGWLGGRDGRLLVHNIDGVHDCARDPTSSMRLDVLHKLVREHHICVLTETRTNNGAFSA